MMQWDALIAELKRMRVETGSLVCLGCGYEHNCGVHGCRILREVISLLDNNYSSADEYIARKDLENALYAGAAADSDKRRRAWVKAISIVHDFPAANCVPMTHSIKIAKKGRE